MTDEMDPVEPSVLIVRILEQIRDEMRNTRIELRDEMRATRTELGGRIDQTNLRLDGTNARLETVEHTLVELATQQRATVKYLREHVASDLTDLRTRVTALEARAG